MIYETIKLKELIAIDHGYAFDGQYITDDDSNPILVTPGNFKIGGGFKKDKNKHYSGSIPESFILTNGDLIVTMTDLSVDCDTLGYPAIIPDNGLFLHNQRIGKVRLISNKIDKRFLYYLLQSKEYHHYVKSTCTGTAIHHTSPSTILKYTVKLPEIDNQRKIAQLLHQFDSKIATLERINDNLMSILETEYQKIKCDHSDDYVLSDLCEIVKDRSSSANLSCDNYYSTENMLPNKAGVSPAASLPSDGKATVCKKGDVLISNIRPYFKKIHYCSELSGCSADVLCFRSKQIVNSPYLFSILHSDDFFDYVVAGSKGTKMPRGDKDQIMDYPIPIPSGKELQSFNSIGNNILSTVSDNAVTIKQLTKLRDYLLPKLMSGEIDVSTLEMLN